MSTQFIGADRVPQSPFLLLPGHLGASQMEALEKHLSSRDITWLAEDGAALPAEIQSRLAASAGKGASFSLSDDPAELGAALKRDLVPSGVLAYLPAKAAASPGTTCRVPADRLALLTSLGLPVLPLAVHLPKASCLSIENPASLPDAVLSFGSLVEPGGNGPSRFLQSLYEADERAFSSRKFLNGSLPEALLAGLKKHGSRTTIYDGTSDDLLPFNKILGAAIALSKELKKATTKPRVGVILPPGKGGLVANLAVLFAGKVPVNINFTASESAVKSSIRQAGLDRFITADPFVRKFPSFPWPPTRDLIHIERLLPQIKKKIIQWVILSKLLPASVLSRMLDLGARRGDDEAVLLFTSGSSGEPKGVPLSHRNLLANVCQFGTRLSFPPDAKILACLPLFHSFGCTVTLWYPCIEGISLVSYPSPLETKRLAELIAQEKVGLLLSTPTFLRGYMRRVDPGQLASLQYVITGAEKLPENLARSFEKKFSHLPLEGYGLTETSPATHVNIPDADPEGSEPVIPTARFGTVGQILPGMAVRFTDPSGGQPVDLCQPGIVHLKGANVFQGYLDMPELNKEVIDDHGWFATGDIGRVDEDGFLHIEGRLSRFSKIGGEMVPHETVEAAINKALGLDDEAERKVAIVGIPDQQKGEAILLLSALPPGENLSLDQQAVELRYKLMDAGLPALWCPKAIKPVDAIPVLASGKLDIKACQALAG